MKRVLSVLLTLMIFIVIWEGSYAFYSSKNKSLVQNSAEAIDINRADISQLIRLKGIGKKRAQAIIDFREKKGGFKKVEDLSKVKGMKGKFFSRFLKENMHRITLADSI